MDPRPGRPGGAAARWSAAVTCLAVLATGCTSTPDTAPAPIVTASDGSEGEVAGPGGVGPVPGSDASGPVTPTVWPLAWLTGSGVSVATSPTLAAPTSDGQVVYEVYDVSAGEEPGTGRAAAQSTTRGPWTVPADILVDGRQYAWRSRSSNDDDWTAPHPFNVDTVRSSLAPRDEIGGVSTHMITGVPAVTWMSRSFPTVSGSAVATMDYSPGRPAHSGLPAGWRWSPPLVSRWTTFVPSEVTADGEPVSVYIADSDQRTMTFTRNDRGVYAQTWANGYPVDSGQSATLTRTADAWQLFEVNGQLTVFSGDRPVAVSSADLLVGTATWSEAGLLNQVSDPSGRVISMRYGSDCSPPAGYAQAPDGFLCQIQWWDGTSSDIHYVGDGDRPQIGQIVDSVTEAEPSAASALGFGWDASGRLSALRSPMVTAAAASDSGLIDRLDVLTEVTYDKQGRVAAVAAPAPAPDAERLVHRYDYPVASSADVRDGGRLVAAVTAEALIGPLSGGESRAIPSTLDGSHAYEMVVDANTWRPLERIDRDGATTRMRWDDRGFRVASTVDYEGRVTSYAYDGEGRRTGFTGPSTSGNDAYSQDSDYDETSDGSPMKGLAARYWPTGAVLTAATTGGWIGSNGDVSETWDASPVGAAWSARFTGTWDTGADKATWVIEAVGAGSESLELYIDNAPCDLDAKDRCKVTLRGGKHSLRVDFTADDAASLRIKAAPTSGDTDPEALNDLDSVSPDFNVATSTTTSDATSGDRERLSTRSTYEQPWTGNPTAVTAAGDLTSTATYEPRGLDGWGRKTSSTTPGGRVTTTSYWPVQGDAQASPCPGASAAIQGGALSSITRTDGVVIQRWYDAAGRVSATLSAPGAGDTARGELACWTYLADGTVRSSALYGPGITPVEQTETTPSIGGDPRVTRTQITSTPPEGLSASTSSTEVVTDLLGRMVSYTDPTGVTFAYTYDVEGNQLTRIASLGERVLLASDQEYDRTTGRPVRMSIDGQEMARIEYDASGRVSRVDYATRARQSYSYGADGSIEVSQVRLGDGTVVEDSIKSNSAGRATARTTQARDSSDEVITQRRWDYAYDEAARLVQAQLTVRGDTAGAGGERTDLRYGFGKPDDSCQSDYARPGVDLNRTSGSRNGVDYIVCYNGAGRPSSTTDPLLAVGGGRATLMWDDLGRFTTSEALEVSWTWGGLPRSIADRTGAVSVTSEFAHALGRLVAQRSADDTTATISRMAYANPSATAPAVILDGAGDPVEVRLLLPGGALWKRSIDDQVVRIDHPGIRGELVVTSDGEGTVVPAPMGGPLAEATGPFGEPLAGGFGPRADAPVYGYGFGDLESTVPGGAGIVLKVARPYLPALGIFLAFDPEPGATTTGYGYAEADPVNFSDPDGAYSWWDFARNVLAVASITASIMIPGAQWYTVLAISVLTSSASIGITALERDANGQSLTAADWIMEGVSVAIDMTIVGFGAGKAMWTARRAATQVTEETVEQLADSAVKTAVRPANLKPPPTLTGSVTRASLAVAGLELMNRALTPSSPQDAGASQGGGIDPEECPNEGGCDEIPARAAANQGPDRL